MKKKCLVKVLLIIIAMALCLQTFIVDSSLAGAQTEHLMESNMYEPQLTVGSCNIYVHDLANLMTDEEEKNLIDNIAAKCKGINYNILFLTTDNAQGKSTIVYTDDYMDALFPVGTENNIAFVIDMNNREVYINTMGNTIKFISDRQISIALDYGYERVAVSDYDGCLETMALRCISYIYEAENQVDTTSFWAAMFSASGLALFITFAVVIILIIKHGRANKATSATNYIPEGSYNVLDKDEIFVRSYETVQHNYYKPKSSSSGGSSHRSSSGRSHGGGGRRF